MLNTEGMVDLAWRQIYIVIISTCKCVDVKCVAFGKDSMDSKITYDHMVTKVTQCRVSPIAYVTGFLATWFQWKSYLSLPICCLIHCGLVHRTGSTLVQVMACCLMAPSHYLNQCWLLIGEDLWHSPKSNYTVSAQVTILYKAFENCTFKNQSHIP